MTYVCRHAVPQQQIKTKSPEQKIERGAAVFVPLDDLLLFAALSFVILLLYTV